MNHVAAGSRLLSSRQKCPVKECARPVGIRCRYGSECMLASSTEFDSVDCYSRMALIKALTNLSPDRSELLSRPFDCNNQQNRIPYCLLTCTRSRTCDVYRQDEHILHGTFSTRQKQPTTRSNMVHNDPYAKTKSTAQLMSNPTHPYQTRHKPAASAISTEAAAMVEHLQSDNPTQQVTHSTGSHDPQIEFQEYKDSSDFLDEKYQDISAVESTHDDDQHSIDYGTGQNHPRDNTDGTDMNFVSPPTVLKPIIGATRTNDQQQQYQLTQRSQDRQMKTSGQQQKQRSTASILRAADGFNAYFLHLLLVQFNIDINQINDHMLVRAYKQHLTGGSLYTTDFKMLALDDILILNQYVPVGLVTRLIRIWKWAYNKTADNSTEDDWIKVTSEELIEASEKYDADQAYKQLKRKMEMEARIAATLPTPAVAQSAAPTTIQDAVPAGKSSVQQFQQRIKVNKKAYPIFKNEDKYTTWKRGMYNTARAQGLEKVFNVDTDPTTFTDEEKELFKAQEAIAMDILVATVPVIACQPIIRRHQDNGTAHACLVEIDQYYTTGQMAMRATERAEKKIRDMILPKDYPHKLAAWFSNWEMTMNDYEEISGETVSEYTKR